MLRHTANSMAASSHDGAVNWAITNVLSTKKRQQKRDTLLSEKKKKKKKKKKKGGINLQVATG